MARRANKVINVDSDTTQSIDDILFLYPGDPLAALAMGGDNIKHRYGFPAGKITSIGGESQAGKTWFCLTAARSIAVNHPGVKQLVYSVEGGIDQERAVKFGVPEGVLYEAPSSVEAFGKKFVQFIEECEKAKTAGIFYLDSYGALTTESKMDNIGEDGNAGGLMETNRKFSDILSPLCDRMQRANVALVVLTHKGVNIAPYGPKLKDKRPMVLTHLMRVALDFASVRKIQKTIDNVTMVVGTETRIKVVKTLYGHIAQEVSLIILFDYGIDPYWTSMLYLYDKKKSGGVRRMFEVFGSEEAQALDVYLDMPDKASDQKFTQAFVEEMAARLRTLEQTADAVIMRKFRARLNKAVIQTWRELDDLRKKEVAASVEHSRDRVDTPLSELFNNEPSVEE